MSYIYIIEKEDNTFVVSFNNNITDRKFSHEDGDILIQFHTKNKNLFLNIVNDLNEIYEPIDKDNFIYKCDKKSFLKSIIESKKKHEFSKPEDKKEHENIIDHDKISKEKEITKIKKNVEKKLSKSFDSLCEEAKKYFLKDENFNMLTFISYLDNITFRQDILDIIKYFFDDDDLRDIDSCGRERIVYKFGKDNRTFEEIIELKKYLPKVDILRYAFDKIETKQQYKIYEKMYLKDKYDGFLSNLSCKKEYCKRMKYKFEDMKYVYGELDFRQLDYLSQNKNLSEKIFLKYFVDKNDKILFKQNILRCSKLDHDLINKYQ